MLITSRAKKYNSKSQVISFVLFYITPEHGTFSQIFDML